MSKFSTRLCLLCWLAQCSSPGAGDPDAGEPTRDARLDGAGSGEIDAAADAELPPTLPQFAIFDDTDEVDASAWAEGLDLIEAALGVEEPTPVRITREQLNTDSDILDGIDGIIFGGGYAYPGYTLRISQAGKQRLRSFVENGGIFAGVCAGAYFACDELSYEGNMYGDESGYDLDLYDGPCHGPVGEIAHYPDWALARIDLPAHPSHPETGPSQANAVWYAGGPYFPDVAPEVTVLATYDDAAIAQHGLPAAIARPLGAGTVILWGPHFEVTGNGASDTNPAVFAEVLRWFAR